MVLSVAKGRGRPDRREGSAVNLPAAKWNGVLKKKDPRLPSHEGKAGGSTKIKGGVQRFRRPRGSSSSGTAIEKWRSWPVRRSWVDVMGTKQSKEEMLDCSHGGRNGGGSVGDAWWHAWDDEGGEGGDWAGPLLRSRFSR